MINEVKYVENIQVANIETEKFFENKLNEIKEKLREYFKSIEYYINVRGHIVYKDVFDEANNKMITVVDYGVVEVDLTVKYYEISEFCSSAIENIAVFDSESYDQLSEEEAEKLYNECFENTVEEINIDHGLYNNVTYKDQDLELETMAIECDGDYCQVGGSIEIKIYHINEYTMNKLFNVLTHVIELLLI